MKKVFLFVAISLGCVLNAVSATADYARLAKWVQQGQYAEALPGLEAYTQKRWRSGEQERGVVLYLESCLHLGKTAEIERVAPLFLDYHTKSIYRDRVETVLAMVEITSGEVFNGMDRLRSVFAFSQNPVVKARARQAVQQVLKAHLLTSDELLGLLEKSFQDYEMTEAVQMELASEFERQERFKAARYWYYRVEFGGGVLAASAAEKRAELNDRGAGVPVVLVLASLSGDFSEFGMSMVQGVLLAQREFQNQKAFSLRIVDDRADASVALQRTKEVLRQDSVIGVIGPVMSAPASAVAAWMGVAAPGIPMITPTATDDGIARMGSNIFQVNISTARLARAIADYAMACLGINEFGIMAPNNDYGSIMTQEFTQLVENRGGRVLAVQTYQEGRPDYKSEFNLLRDRKFNLDLKRRNMARGNSNLTAMASKEKKSWMEDSIVVYPGLFIPSSDPSDAGLMAGQAAFYKLGGRLLGSSGWYGRDLLVNGKRQVEQSYFSVPFAESTDSPDYQRFVKQFKESWQKEPSPDKVSGLSYDATRILLTAWNQVEGSSLADWITAKQTFPGVYGQVRFRNGANQNTHILSVENTKFSNKTQCAESDHKTKK